MGGRFFSDCVSQSSMMKTLVCKHWTPVGEWVRDLPGEMVIDRDCHWPWECRQQTTNPKELWQLCNQAILHPGASWLCNGKRESISSYSAANQSPESTRLGREDCISHIHTKEKEAAGAWDGVVWSKGIFWKRKASCLLHYGPAE